MKYTYFKTYFETMGKNPMIHGDIFGKGTRMDVDSFEDMVNKCKTQYNGESIGIDDFARIHVTTYFELDENNQISDVGQFYLLNTKGEGFEDCSDLLAKIHELYPNVNFKI